MDAPYHNIFGQTTNPSNNGEIFSVSFDEDNPDAYTFNNQ